MLIHFSPQRSDDSLTVDVHPLGLVINGVLYDLSAVTDEAEPVGPILAAGPGAVTLRLPLPMNPAPEAAFPASVEVEDGPVAVPGHPRALDEAGAAIPQEPQREVITEEATDEDGNPVTITRPGEVVTVVVANVAPPVLSVEEARAQVWEQIKARREALKSGGIKVGDHWFHSDADSRIQQLGLVIMGANMPPGLKWKTIDNGLVDMTPALAGQIFAGTAQHDAQVFGVAEMHRAALWAAADPLSYDWSAGWPQESPEVAE